MRIGATLCGKTQISDSLILRPWVNITSWRLHRPWTIGIPGWNFLGYNTFAFLFPFKFPLYISANYPHLSFSNISAQEEQQDVWGFFVVVYWRGVTKRWEKITWRRMALMGFALKVHSRFESSLPHCLTKKLLIMLSHRYSKWLGKIWSDNGGSSLLDAKLLKLLSLTGINLVLCLPLWNLRGRFLGNPIVFMMTLPLIHKRNAKFDGSTIHSMYIFLTIVQMLVVAFCYIVCCLFLKHRRCARSRTVD